MEQLTVKTGVYQNGKYEIIAGMKCGVEFKDILDRLAAIEDILGDKYNLDRLQELKQADDEGRCVVLPKDRMVYFHEESIDSGEKWVGNWPIKDILLKCGFGIASLTYSIRDVGNKIYFDRNEAQVALRREQDEA